jgi:hypothetical protein
MTIWPDQRLLDLLGIELPIILARKDMAIESTPDRSFSLLFRSSRAADATTGCGLSPKWGVVIMARKVDSMGGFGSERKCVTPESVLSGSA